jgi:hypothetical protein
VPAHSPPGILGGCAAPEARFLSCVHVDGGRRWSELRSTIIIIIIIITITITIIIIIIITTIIIITLIITVNRHREGLHLAAFAALRPDLRSAPVPEVLWER